MISLSGPILLTSRTMCWSLHARWVLHLGKVMREAEPQLEWLADWPYWESGLLDVPSGYHINVFQWAIKRFSEHRAQLTGYSKTVRGRLASERTRPKPSRESGRHTTKCQLVRRRRASTRAPLPVGQAG